MIPHNGVGAAAPDPPGRHWYVARLKWRAERRAASILAGKGVGVFLPELRRGPRRGRRPQAELLFPGYVFVHLDIGAEEVLIARSSPGVQYLLGYRGIPSAVPEELVEAIRTRAEQEGLARGPVGFREGERVRITAPQWREVEAIFDRSLSAARRVRVFIELLGRRVPVEVEASQLRRA